MGRRSMKDKICDRCGKKVDTVYLIGISIADLKGKFYYCKGCTCEFIDKWDAFHKEPKIESIRQKRMAESEPQEKQCADCKHYDELFSLDCARCDVNHSMYEPRESEDKNGGTT